MIIFGTNCIGDLDPAGLVVEEKAVDTLQNYRVAVAEKIAEKFPTATLIWQDASPCDSEFAVRSLNEFEDEDAILDQLQNIASRVFEKGEFYA